MKDSDDENENVWARIEVLNSVLFKRRTFISILYHLYAAYNAASLLWIIFECGHNGEVERRLRSAVLRNS